MFHIFIKLEKESLLKLKSIIKGLSCLLLCVASIPAIYAELKDHLHDPSKKDLKGVFLIFDNVDDIKNYSKPKKYRSGADLYSIKLNISGSAQPNLKDVEYIIATAQQFVTDHKKIFFVDLRQEPHALLNDNAVSWFGFRNQVAYNLEQRLVARLSLSKTAKVYRAVDKLEDGFFIPKNYSVITIHKVVTEQRAVESLGVKYQRFVVTDHFAPEEKQVDLFVHFIKNLPRDAWVHFHCRGGKGRTTTFMVLYDIIVNAHLLPLDVILQRQYNLGGVKLSESTFNVIRKKWKEPAAKYRYGFIKKFYKYVLDPEGYNKCKWSEWLKGN